MTRLPRTFRGPTRPAPRAHCFGYPAGHVCTNLPAGVDADFCEACEKARCAAIVAYFANVGAGREQAS
jgi:hypothetical protein